MQKKQKRRHSLQILEETHAGRLERLLLRREVLRLDLPRSDTLDAGYDVARLLQRHGGARDANVVGDRRSRGRVGGEDRETCDCAPDVHQRRPRRPLRSRAVPRERVAPHVNAD